MIKRKWPMYLAILAVVIAISYTYTKIKYKTPEENIQEVTPVIGDIQTVITSTATVQPQNRLEIKPPINGRIDEILVKEGDEVKTGQVLVLMSSTERAALLDAARTRSPEEIKYWSEVYRPTPLLSPIDGEVIVSQDDPGQIVTSNDVVMVLSDKLMVQAQVDETDIGKIRVGQKATITLDAYPNIKITGEVSHIYYESTTVNNVVIYYVDILPDAVSDVFRSGMSATVSIVEDAKRDVLMLPLAAVKNNDSGSYVLLSQGNGKKPIERKITTGISDEKNVEIVSGLTGENKVLITTQKYKASSSKTGTNPLMPSMPKRKK